MSLSTHVLDVALGRPAAGMAVELWADEELVTRAVTGPDGRPPQPLVAAGALEAREYELRFAVGEHLGPERAGLLDVVPIRFTVRAPQEHHHVPLLFTPWSYSTYRGS